MKKIVRLTESQLIGTIKKIINESYGRDMAIDHWIDMIEECIRNYDSIDCDRMSTDYERFYCQKLDGESKKELKELLANLEHEKVSSLYNAFSSAFGKGSIFDM